MSTIFPKWTNHLPTALAFGGLGAVSAVVGVVWYYFTPKFWEVGYMPTQPGGGFSHLIHAGKLGMDCRYCHSHVEGSAEANIPAAATCYGCHAENHVKDEFARPEFVKFIREAYAKDEPIAFRRVHKLPDYVRNFPHDVHVAAGVSCYSCHGMIARQAVVHQVHSLAMAWCLDCHRDPAPSLVPPSEVTNLFEVEKQLLQGGNPPTSPHANWPGSPGGKALLEALKLTKTGEPNSLHILPENCGACHY